MQKVEVDAVGSQASQAAFRSFDRAPARSVVGQDLGDDVDLVTAPLDGLSRHLFGTAAAIHLGRVDERHAEIETALQRRHLLGPLGRILAHPIGAQTKRGQRGTATGSDPPDRGALSFTKTAHVPPPSADSQDSIRSRFTPKSLFPYTERL